jgi:hypothetical protein
MSEHVGGHRMTDQVRSDLRQPGPVTRGAHHHPDRIAAQAFNRCSRPQEQSSALRTRTAHLEVGGDGLPDIAGNGEAVTATSLAVDDDLSCPPVHVVEAEQRHLPTSEPKASEQRQDREISSPDGRRLIAAPQQEGHLSGVECTRQRSETPGRDRRDRRGQVERRAPLCVEEPQQRPKRRRQSAERLRRPGWRHFTSPAGLEHEARHGARRKVFEIEARGSGELVQEEGSVSHVGANRRGRQRSLAPEVARVLIQQLLRRRSRGPNRRLRHDIQGAQVVEERGEGTSRGQPGPALCSSCADELIDHFARYLGNRESLELEPAAQVCHQQQANRCG